MADLRGKGTYKAGKMSRLPHQPARNLKVYIEASTLCLHGLNNTFLSQGCIGEAASRVEIVGGMYIPRTGRG